MGNSNGEMGFEYWCRWQVPVCGLIIAIPTAMKRSLKSSYHLSHGCLWIPSWRGMNPKWLLLYRILAFISLALGLYKKVASFGLFAFYFYFQWTFTLVMVYFAIATIVSARGCWLDSERYPTGAGEKDKFLNDRSNECWNFNMDQVEDQAGFWGYLMHVVYHVSAGASIFTNMVFWCVLVPMLSGKEFKLTMLIGLTHSLNIVSLIIDSSLNNLPFQWFGFTYFAWWTVFYVTFQWIVHACGFTRYLWFALIQFPCYGLYIILTKAMISGFSRLFPKAYTRLS